MQKDTVFLMQDMHPKSTVAELKQGYKGSFVPHISSLIHSSYSTFSWQLFRAKKRQT